MFGKKIGYCIKNDRKKNLGKFGKMVSQKSSVNFQSTIS